MFDSLFKLIDPKKLGFKDKCFSEKDKGLGIICGAYVILLCLWLIIISVTSIGLYLEHRKNLKSVMSEIKYILFFAIIIMWQFVAIVFIINACHMCNGLYAFLFLMVVGSVFGLLMRRLFEGMDKEILKLM